MCCILPHITDFKNGQAKTGCFRFAREVIYRLAKGRRYRVVGYKSRPPGCEQLLCEGRDHRPLCIRSADATRAGRQLPGGG